MNALTIKLKTLKKTKRKALVFFITAGYPNLNKTYETAVELHRAGADIIEIGVPFSDPIADGPVIQASSDHAIKKGINLTAAFNLARKIKDKTGIPIVLMTYLNPLLRNGLDETIVRAAKNGVDGFIIPDMPIEECAHFGKICRNNKLSLVQMAAPNTEKNRMRAIGKMSDSFVYIVSLTGVTGQRKGLPEFLNRFLRTTKTEIKRPRFLGFGISNKEQIAKIKKQVDGVIVGSALIKLMKSDKKVIYTFASSLRQELDRK